MVDRLVPRGSAGAADEGIGGVVPKGNVSRPLAATEVVAHGLADEERERDAPASRLILELPVGVLREPQIRDHVFCHADTTIAHHRCIVNVRGAFAADS